MLVGGVDGCPGGWVAVVHDTARPELVTRVYPTLRALLAAHPDAAVIAVDIPIGLASGALRPCDLAARGALGPSRASSVFPAPDRRLIETLPFTEDADGRLTNGANYEEATALAVQLTGKGISRQAYAILPKIREVDRLRSAFRLNGRQEDRPAGGVVRAPPFGR